MHVIYLVRRVCKYHIDQSHGILLTDYFFYLKEGTAFWSIAPSSTMAYYATDNGYFYWNSTTSIVRLTGSGASV